MEKLNLKRNSKKTIKLSRKIEESPETYRTFNYLNFDLHSISSDYEIFEDDQDLLLIVETLKRFFINFFSYEYKNDKLTEKQKRQFIVDFEKKLFENGNVAIIKTPDGNIYPVSFSVVTKNDIPFVDFYGNPTKIKIETMNAFNGKIFNEKDFVIIYNNALKQPTLFSLYRRLRELIKSLRYVDNANFDSQHRLLLPQISANDQKYVDFKNKYEKGDKIIPYDETTFQSEKMIQYNPDDKTKTKEENFLFQLNLITKFLGIGSNDLVNKKERITEDELEMSDTFGTKLIEDMFIERKSALMDIKEKFNIEILINQDENKNDNQINNNDDHINGSDNNDVSDDNLEEDGNDQ